MLRPAISLAVVGTVVSAVITGFVASWLFDLSTLEGLLLGAVLVVDRRRGDLRAAARLDARAQARPDARGRVRPQRPDGRPARARLHRVAQPSRLRRGRLLVLFVRQVGIGLAVGVAVGAATTWVLRRAQLDSGGLYPVASLTAAALAFGGADSLHGSGFLAVYLTGVWLGTAGIPALRTVTSFHQGTAWVAQVVLFLSLGLLVFPSELGGIAVEGTVLALVLVFVARPAAVWVSTVIAGSYSFAERVILAVAGLRGAVPVVLATFPVIAGVQGSGDLFNIVFFAVLLSTVLQGLSFEPLARKLGVTTREPALPRPLAEAGTIRRLGAEILEFPIEAGHAIAGARVRDLGLPREAVVNVIVRDDQAIPPRGSTRLLAGDELHVLIRQEQAGELPGLMRRWREGPVGPTPRPRRVPAGRPTVHSVRPAAEGAYDGDLSRPRSVLGEPTVAQLRIRRDTPGALVALADGRYAVTGPLIVVGSRRGHHRASRRGGCAAWRRTARSAHGCRTWSARWPPTCPNSRRLSAIRAARKRRARCGRRTGRAMRNRQLHAALAAFAEEAAWQLASLTAEGAEVPFEVVASGRRDAPLYCYRPLTGDFIAQRVSLLGRLPSHVPALGALSGQGGLEALPAGARRARPARSRASARTPRCACSLGRVFEDSTDFELSPRAPRARLRRARGRALRRAHGDGRASRRCSGSSVGSPEVALGDGLSLVHGRGVRRGRARRRGLGAGRAARPPARRAALGGGAGRPLAGGARARAAAPAARPRCDCTRRATSPSARSPGRGRAGARGSRSRSARSATAAGRPAHRPRRRRGRAARLLQPHRPPHAAPGRGRMGAAPLRDGLRPLGAGRGAHRPPARAARRCSSPRGPASGRLPGRLAALCAGPRRARRAGRSASPARSRSSAPVIGGMARDPGDRRPRRRARRRTCARCCATCSAGTSTPTCARSPTRSSPRRRRRPPTSPSADATAA